MADDNIIGIDGRQAAELREDQAARRRAAASAAKCTLTIWTPSIASASSLALMPCSRPSAKFKSLASAGLPKLPVNRKRKNQSQAWSR
jgi:hypothetical protein